MGVEDLFTCQSSHSTIFWGTLTLLYLCQINLALGHLLIYGMLLVNLVLVTMLILAKFSKGSSTSASEGIFQIMWAPVGSVLQYRHDLDSVDPGHGDDLPAISRQILGLILMDFCHQKSLVWLLLLPLTRLVLARAESRLARAMTYRKRLPTGRGFDISRALHHHKTSSARPPSLLPIVTLLAVYFLFGCDVTQLVASVLYCGAVQRTGEEYLSLRYGHVFEHLLDCTRKTMFDGIYFLLELIVAVAYVIIGARWLSVVIIPAAYVNIYDVINRLRSEVIESFRKERRDLDVFPRASKQEVTSYNDVCAICLLSMSSMNARKTPCDHLFHGRCLRLCLNEKNACPLCNRRLSIYLGGAAKLTRHHSTGSLNTRTGNLHGL